MKSILTIVALLMGFQAFAKESARTILWVGDTQVVSAEYRDLVRLKLDMYDFVKRPNKAFCYEGNPAGVEALVQGILAVGTGDSNVDGTKFAMARKTVKVTINWDDEGGGHVTRRNIAPCR